MSLRLVHSRVPAVPAKTYLELVDALENGKIYKVLYKGWLKHPNGRQTVNFIYLQPYGTVDIVPVAFTGSPPQHTHFKVIGERLAVTNEF